MIKFFHEKGAAKYTENVIRKLESEEFFEAAARIKNFDERYTRSDVFIPSAVNGAMILTPLLTTKTEKLRIGFYTQNWFAYRFCPVNGYVDSTGRNMFLNRRQLWRPLKEIEETIWHELVHVSDAINTSAVYWHGDNNLKGKDETAPVKFAKWAASWE